MIEDRRDVIIRNTDIQKDSGILRDAKPIHTVINDTGQNGSSMTKNFEIPY